MSADVAVEILHVEGCTGAPMAVETVKAVARELGIDVRLTRTLVSSPGDAAEHRFPGSPTVRIDGLDVDPSLRGAEQPALT